MIAIHAPLARHRSAPESRSALARLLLAGLLTIVGACSSLPTDVQRTPSQALEDTADTRIAQFTQPLVAGIVPRFPLNPVAEFGLKNPPGVENPDL